MVLPFVLSLLSCTLEVDESGLPEASATTPEGTTSVVLILMDDMRYDDLWAMPWVNKNLAPMGLSFDAAYVNTPVCCPARASIAAGGYLAQSTGVLSNYLPNGGATLFNNERTMAATLQAGGLRTGFIGKYMHGHPPRAVPRGWSWFNLPLIAEDWSNFEVATGASTSTAIGSGTISSVSQYLTDYISDQSLAFLEETGSDPFFLWINPWAPHYPATPADEDLGTYASVTLRPPSFNEADVEDKPEYVRESPLLGDSAVRGMDGVYQSSMESLISADRAVRALVEKLEELGRLDDTVIIFTSDNGYLYGEHRQTAKGMPYQESIRVPLIIVAPGGATGRESRLVSVTTDVPATIQDLAGVTPDTEGVSLRPLLDGRPVSWQDRLLIEGYEGSFHLSFAGVVEQRWKYVEYTGENVELYDLTADPFELESKHQDESLATVRQDMAEWLDGRRGLLVKTIAATMQVGTTSTVVVEAVGGTSPFTWSAVGDLPDGLSLTSEGLLQGDPEVAGEYTVGLTVTGSGIRRHKREAESIYGSVRLTVLNESGSSGFAPVDGQERVTVRGDGVDVEIPAPAGHPVYVTLSPNGDFGDGLRFQAVGPAAVISFEGLTPGGRYQLLIESRGLPVVREIEIPR